MGIYMDFILDYKIGFILEILIYMDLYTWYQQKDWNLSDFAVHMGYNGDIIIKYLVDQNSFIWKRPFFAKWHL